MRIIDGWLDFATSCPSPNCNDRISGADVDLLVIHNISLPAGQFGTPYIRQLFTNCLNPDAHESFADIAGLQVSSHLLIARDGSVTQFVPFHRRAWHAGVSEWQGREGCNDFSIGIELEGTDDLPYDARQYAMLAEVTRLLMQDYQKLTPETITGHSNIAPGRKTDPGDAFDWGHYRSLLS